MSSNGEEGASTSQSFTAFWMAGPESPATPIVGNPVANPVAAAELATLGSSEVVSASASVQQTNLTTMSNAVPHDEFGQTPSLTNGASVAGNGIAGDHTGNADGTGNAGATLVAAGPGLGGKTRNGRILRYSPYFV